MTSFTAVLRGLCFEAYDLRGQNGFPAACERIYRTWTVWPLVVANEAIADAEQELLENSRRRELALQWLRESHLPERRVASRAA
jgi:hypothetical protein